MRALIPANAAPPLAAGAVAAGSAAVLLLCLVALASRPLGVAPSPSAESSLVAALLVNAGAFVLVGLGALMLLALVYVFSGRLPRPRTDGAAGRASSRKRLLALLVFLVVLPALWLRGQNNGSLPPLQPGGGPLPAAPNAAPLPGAAWLPYSAGLAVLLVLVGAVLILRPRRRPVVVDHPPDDAATVDQALADALSELDLDADPRRAVIAAYAALERTLASGGLPRRPSEAPFEYLARVLRQAAVSGSAVLRLTELFERAKFSQHTIEVTMRAEAVNALSQVRSEAEQAGMHAAG